MYSLKTQTLSVETPKIQTKLKSTKKKSFTMRLSRPQNIKDLKINLRLRHYDSSSAILLLHGLFIQSTENKEKSANNSNVQAVFTSSVASYEWVSVHMLSQRQSPTNWPRLSGVQCGTLHMCTVLYSTAATPSPPIVIGGPWGWPRVSCCLTSVTSDPFAGRHYRDYQEEANTGSDVLPSCRPGIPRASVDSDTLC